MSKLIPLRTVNHQGLTSLCSLRGRRSWSRVVVVPDSSLTNLLRRKVLYLATRKDSTYGSLASTSSGRTSPSTMSVGSWSTFSFGSNRSTDPGSKAIMVKMAFKLDTNCSTTSKEQLGEKYQLTTTLKVILLEFMCIFDETTTSVNVSGTFLWHFYTNSVLNTKCCKKLYFGCISIHFLT